MKRYTTMIAVAALGAALGLWTPAAHAASGALDALGKDGKSRGGCPLEHTEVKATVSGFVARVVVTQRFRNPFPEPIEAVYTFPLSERGAVDAMTMTTGVRVIEGEIHRREEARKIYEAAKAAGQVTALLDEERPNVFTQSVANLLPGAAIDVRIEYVEPLAFTAGTFELSVPTVVGPRFNPTSTGGADEVTPPVTPEGTHAGHDVSIAVDVDAGVPIQAIASALHAIDVQRPSPERATVSLQEGSALPNRDFVLRWTVSTDQLQSTYLAHRTGSGDGYLSLVLLPPARVTATEAAPKELVFVIDRSGSQMGAPLDKAKETMRYILEHMHPNDTFQVVDFGSTSNALFATPQLASPEMKRRARTYIDALEANGGTMMAEAVERVCNMPADANRLRIVTFMTDGYVGNDFEVLGLVQKLRATSRWFPFGTGNGVNRFLIDGMAKLGGGEPDYVLLTASGDEVGRTFWDKISSPVLTDVKVAFEGLDVIETFPVQHGDVWAERPLVVQARYRRAGSGKVLLTGFRQGKPYRQELPVTLPEQEPAHEAIASMWARAKVDALMAQDLQAMQSGTFPKPLEEQIVAVALQHRLLTKFTSFVAVEQKVVNEGGVTRTVRVPVEMPDGVKYEGIFGAAERAPMEQARSLGYVAAGAAKAAAPAGRRLASPPPPPAPEPTITSADREEKDDAAPLTKREQRRLDAALRVLLEQGAGAPGAAAVVDGWVRVAVDLHDASSAIVRAVQAAGVQVESVTGNVVTGLVKRQQLRALLAVPQVRLVRAV
jgi:Ca-activated chloride channel family protein